MDSSGPSFSDGAPERPNDSEYGGSHATDVTHGGYEDGSINASSEGMPNGLMGDSKEVFTDWVAEQFLTSQRRFQGGVFG